MGRRKIEIEPITDERNRTVTFIKRKAGLFKKAHELAVLCQVDVTLIILGHNNTFYEFSSVDTKDMLDHYKNDKSLLHDIRDPSFYGENFTKKKCINNHDHHKNLHATNNTTHTHDTMDSTGLTDNKSKRSLRLLTDPHSDSNHLNKKFRIGLNSAANPAMTTNPVKNSLSNIVDLNTSSTSKHTNLTSPLNSNSSSISTFASSSNSQKKISSRPILRVQIPHSNTTISNTTSNNNTTNTTANSIKNDFSEINSNVYGNTSPQNYRILSPDTTNINISKQSNILKNNKDSDTSALLKNNHINSNNTATATATTAFSFTSGLPPLSAMSPYIATPLQNSSFHPPLIQTNTTNNKTTTTATTTTTNSITSPVNTKNNTNKFGLKLNINKINLSQRYHQQNAQGKSSSPIYSIAPTSATNNTNFSNINNNNGSLLSGALPSKYVNDLMIPSPSGFSDWNLNVGPQSAGTRFMVPPNPIGLTTNTNPINSSMSNSNFGTTTISTNSTIMNNSGNNNSSNNINDVSSSSSSSLVLAAQGYDPSNGNTGLTPYIGIGQTPLTNRFFTFSTSNINSPDTQIKKNEPLTTTNSPTNVNDIKAEDIDDPILDKDDKD